MLKKIAVMQPYFFPYIGYFSLIKSTDQFILLDEVQYIYHGWINRNRILKPDGEDWQYFRAPVQKHSQASSIWQIKLDNTQRWREKIFAQLEHYKKAGFYRETMKILDEVFSSEYESITDLNKSALDAVCAYLGIETQISVFSVSGLKIEKPDDPDEWALNICKALGDVAEYWNPIGGAEFFDVSKYRQIGIEIKFLKHDLPEYRQKGGAFIPGLSILDVLMTNSADDVCGMLDQFSLISGD